VAQRGNIPLVTLRRARITGADAMLKRAFDVIGALIGLVIVGPLALLALLRGGVLGRHPLINQLHLRSARDGVIVASVLNVEVSSSLLVRGAPALLAVLAGRMSLVGPRQSPERNPPTPSQVSPLFARA